MTDTYLLYGVPASYFTAKVRAYLRKQRLDFEERSSAHPDFGARIHPATQRIFLPVLEWPDGSIVQDSDDIIERLETEGAGRLSCHPPGPVQNVLSHLFNLFGSEGLVRLAMHFRWSYLDQQDAFIAAGFIHGTAPESPPDEAEAMARPMMNKLASYLEPLGVSDASIPAIEQAYDDLLAALHDDGIPAFTGICGEIYREEAFLDAGYAPDEPLEVARELSETAIMVPIHPLLTDEDVLAVAEKISRSAAQLVPE